MSAEPLRLPYGVLFVEDDPQIGALVETHLHELGCQVDWVQSGTDGLRCFQKGRFDLVILDLILPSLNGLDVCRRIREKDHYTPILMLTAKAEKRDVVLGLELGADDYVTKPFSTPELIARIRAIFRRMEADREQAEDAMEREPLQRGALVIYPHQRKVTLNGRRIALTTKEFDLLLLFARAPGRTYSRRELLNAIWGPGFEGYDHTVNTHINRLRSKIEMDTSEPTYLKTVWGVGYRFAELEELC